MDLIEEWKPVPGYNGAYEISSMGEVKSFKKDSNGKLLKKILNKGYLYIALCKKSKYTKFAVHRLVATAFVPNTENKPHVNHKDLNPQNNNFSNLEWVTPKENSLHSFRSQPEKHISETRGDKHGGYKGDVLAYKDGELKFILKGSLDMKSKGFDPSFVTKCLNGKKKTCKGYTFERRGIKRRKILVKSNGEPCFLLKTLRGGNILGFTKYAIQLCLSGKQKIHHGFTFEYESHNDTTI